MKKLLQINDLIDIKISTFLLLLLTFLTGQFKSIVIFLILSGIHEFGHLIACLLFKVEIKRIVILPFGFNLQIKDLDKLTPIKQSFVYLCGPLMFFINLAFINILYKNQLISYVTYNFCLNGNIAINLFNLLPIYPLDGFKIFNGLVQYLLPYKKSLLSGLFVSIIFFISLLVYNIFNPQIVITIFLFIMQFQYIKEIPILYKKFLFSKTYYKKHKKFKIIKDYDMYKECNNYKFENNEILDDKMIAFKLLGQK